MESLQHITVKGVKFTLRFNKFSVYVEDFETGGILWNLKPVENDKGKAYKMENGNCFPRAEIKYFRDDIEKKVLVLWKRWYGTI